MGEPFFFEHPGLLRSVFGAEEGGRVDRAGAFPFLGHGEPFGGWLGQVFDVPGVFGDFEEEHFFGAVLLEGEVDVVGVVGEGEVAGAGGFGYGVALGVEEDGPEAREGLLLHLLVLLERVGVVFGLLCPLRLNSSSWGPLDYFMSNGGSGGHFSIVLKSVGGVLKRLSHRRRLQLMVRTVLAVRFVHTLALSLPFFGEAFPDGLPEVFEERLSPFLVVTGVRDDGGLFGDAGCRLLSFVAGGLLAENVLDLVVGGGVFGSGGVMLVGVARVSSVDDGSGLRPD